MHSGTSRAYLQSQVMTATTEELQMMLYEGAVRFAQQCRSHLDANDFEAAQFAYERVDAIMCELHSGLRPNRDAQMVDNFASLYNFVQIRMDEGNLKHDSSKIDDALQILRHLRETWRQVLDVVREERRGQPQDHQAEVGVGLTIDV